MPRNADIHDLLDRVEATSGVRILYACESGSRAWGFASPDSDYDIRFLFVRPEHDYLSLRPGPDSIDLAIADDLDPGGWDVKKAAMLLAKSNGALFEWLHSPIVYREADGFLERWREAARAVFLPRASADHYRGMAKQMLRAKLIDARVRAKDYLYAMRSIFSARWVLDGRGIAPVAFADLMPVVPDEICALVPDLLKQKAATAEAERMARIPLLDEFLEAALGRIERDIAAIPQRVIETHQLDRLVWREIKGPEGAVEVGVPAPAEWTLARVRQKDVLLFDTIAGSHAYGTAIEGSDEDRRGVFVAPPSFLLGLNEISQVSDERNDETYYELGRFVAMLLKNNPNALELLGMPEDCIRFRHPVFERLKPDLFLSKMCGRTFGEYAMGQIRKARGLNKKIVNPQPEQRHELPYFCRVPEGQGSVLLLDWLSQRGMDPRDCGLTAVQGAPGMHAVYHDPSANYRGIISRKNPDSLVHSSVSKEAEPVVWMHCNQNAFQAHCKAHREYWDWVAHRNEERYATNASHGRGYDSKNLLHTLRLLEMAGEIAKEGVIRVRRPNRDFLLQVRAGEFAYEDLVKRAETQLESVREAFEASSLPEAPDREQAINLLVSMREEFQSSHGIA